MPTPTTTRASSQDSGWGGATHVQMQQPDTHATYIGTFYVPTGAAAPTLDRVMEVVIEVLDEDPAVEAATAAAAACPHGSWPATNVGLDYPRATASEAASIRGQGNTADGQAAKGG